MILFSYHYVGLKINKFYKKVNPTLDAKINRTDVSQNIKISMIYNNSLFIKTIILVKVGVYRFSFCFSPHIRPGGQAPRE
jgi:hypothetical protein